MAALRRTVQGELAPCTANLTHERHKNVDSCADARPESVLAANKPHSSQSASHTTVAQEAPALPAAIRGQSIFKSESVPEAKFSLAQQQQELFDIPAP